MTWIYALGQSVELYTYVRLTIIREINNTASLPSNSSRNYLLNPNPAAKYFLHLTSHTRPQNFVAGVITKRKFVMPASLKA